MNTSTELRAEAHKIANQARELLNSITAENRADKEAEFDRMMADADAYEARAARMDKADAFSAAYDAADERRPSEERAVETVSAEDREARAFDAYVRSGDRTELRAQNVGTAADGGYLVPQTWATGIITALKAYGPLNDDSVVSYLNTAGGGQLNLPSNDDTANKGRKIAEGATANSVSLTFGTKALNAYKYTTDVVLVSSELLQDAAYDVQGFIASAMAERMGRIVNEVMTTGDGTDDPNGIATAAANGKTAASASAIAADELIDLIHSVDPAYRSNAAFMFADSTLAALRKLKDGEGRYIWQPGLVAGEAATILGHRFHINQDMAAIGASAKSVLFGDFRRYTVRRVKGFEFKRLNERYADSDQVGFIGFARYDGELLDARAVKALTQAAS